MTSKKEKSKSIKFLKKDSQKKNRLTNLFYGGKRRRIAKKILKCSIPERERDSEDKSHHFKNGNDRFNQDEVIFPFEHFHFAPRA